MELVFIFTEVLVQIGLVDLFEVVKVKGALWVHAFMDDEVFPVFLRDESMSAMGTAQGVVSGETVVIRGETCAADLAAKLSGRAVVAVEIGLRSIAGRAAAVLRDVALLMA